MASADYVSGPYRLVAMDGNGHWLPEEVPDDVNRLLLGHLREAAGDVDGVEAQLGRIRARFSQAMVRGDGGALAAAYTHDGVLLPPDREIRGAQAIGRYFTTGRDGYRQVAHSMIPDEVRVRGDVASEVGTWSSTIQRPGQERTTTGDRYLLVWERGEDGQWRIAYDMWHR